MEKQSAAPHDEESTSADATNTAFRVCTVEDFNSSHQQSQFKRRTGLPSTACHMCRLRKVKCDISIDSLDAQDGQEPSYLLRCQACKQSDIECRWDTIDRRKRRKLRTRTGSSQQQWFQTTDVAGAGSETQQNAGFEFLDANVSMSQSAQQHSKNSFTRYSSGEDLRAMNHGPIRFPNCHEELGPGHAVRESTPLLRDFCSLENLEVPYDWSGMQDFVLDFEAIGTPCAATRSHSLDVGENDGGPRPPRMSPKAVRVRFYRRFGPTAIVPGLRKLSIAVDIQKDAITNSEEVSAKGHRSETSRQGSLISPQGTVSDEASPYDLDIDSIYKILDAFFQHFAGHFPFLNPQIFAGHVRSGHASSFLINAITALTMRFYPSEITSMATHQKCDGEWQRGAPFLKRAKEQLVSLLGIPEPEVVASLLILAWAEFGENNEAGLWMVSGMAIRMAQDLGFHRSPNRGSDPTMMFYDRTPLTPEGKDIITDEQSTLHQQKARLVMFWSVFIMDVCVSLHTGRPPTLRLTEIEVPVPTAEDMKLAQLDFQEAVSMDNIIFPAMVLFMIEFSKVVELLNQNQTLEKRTEGGRHAEDGLARVRDDLMKQYQSLDSELIFSIENYKKASCIGHSGLFLMLHLYFYTFIILISTKYSRDARHDHDPTSQRNPDNDQQSCKVALTACHKIVQVLNVAEFVEKNGYLSTPFINNCFFVAASVILEGHKSTGIYQCQEPRDFLSLVGGSDFDYLCQKLQEQSRYFKAIGATLNVLERRKRGPAASGNDRNQATAGEESDEDKDTIVELGDPGIVNRYTILELSDSIPKS